MIGRLSAAVVAIVNVASDAATHAPIRADR